MFNVFEKDDQDLDLFYKEVIEKLPNTGSPIVENAELILGAAFDKNKGTLTLYPMEGGVTWPYELRLLEEDCFRATHIAGEFWKVNETLGSENYGVTPFTYPESTVFLGKKNTSLETQAMEAVYGGVINIQRGRTVFLKDYPVRSLLVAPERQASDGKYYQTANDSRYKRLTIQPCFGGKGTVTLTVQLAQTTAEMMELLVGNLKADGSAVAGQKNHFVVRLRGFRVVGAGAAFQEFRKEYAKSMGIRE
jgi:hypothetical protein